MYAQVILIISNVKTFGPFVLCKIGFLGILRPDFVEAVKIEEIRCNYIIFLLIKNKLQGDKKSIYSDHPNNSNSKKLQIHPSTSPSDVNLFHLFNNLLLKPIQL